ncbi:hypothetical protein [Virgibacillus ihumii]|uniref:hypothetical protein n=1 Tax=Virgibacillus ihumii TaxID=2686091 RepID=UPI00157BEE74|nr:hypothetical protein [Virgibacillus ihumii]
MLKTLSYLLITAFVLFTVAACDAGNDEQEETRQQPAQEASTKVDKSTSEDLKSGVEQVLSAVEDLKEANDVKTVKKYGNALRESWDKIEKEVEENYLNYYMNIEHTLYPLIDETQNTKPNSEKISKLSDVTVRKLEAFKEKIGPAAAS